MDEIVYIGDYHNRNDFILKDGDAPLDLSSVTQIDINIEGIDVSSTNQSADPVRWDQIGYETGEVRCTLGGISGLDEGNRRLWMVVIDPTNPNGVVYGPITIFFIALP